MKEISAEVDGRRFWGNYVIEYGVLTVATACSRKASKVGGRGAESLAKVMLGQIIREEITKGFLNPRPRGKR